MQLTLDDYKKLTKSIVGVQGYSVITHENTDQFFQALLKEFLEITQGECGFIGALHRQESGQLSLQIKAVAAGSGDTAAIESITKWFGENLQSWLRNVSTIVEHPDSETFLIDEQESTTDSGRLPAESACPENLMALPILCSDTPVGIVAVKRPERGSSEEWAEFLQPLLNVSGPLIYQLIGQELFLEHLSRDGQAIGETHLGKYEGTPIPVSYSCHLNPRGANELLWWFVDLSREDETKEKFLLRDPLLEKVLEHLPLGAFCKDVKNDFRYTIFNGKCEELFGLRAKKVLGKTGFEFLRREEADEFMQEDLEIIRSGKIMLKPEQRIDSPDGGTFYVRITKLCVYDSGGKPSLIVGTAEDITESRDIERSLQTSERRFRQLAEHAPVGIFLTDPKGACIFVNDHWQKMAGLSQDEADGLGWQKAVHDDDLEEMRSVWQKFIMGQAEFSLEYRFVRPDGAVTWVSGSAVRFRNHAGQVIGFLACATDVSDHKQFEHKLQISTDEAQRANAAKSEFLSRMSHELRTPLNAILGFGQLLEMDKQNLSEHQFEGVEHILAAGDHLLELIEDVLDLSRIEGGHSSLKLHSVSSTKVIQRSIYMVEDLADSGGIQLYLPASETPHVVADSRRLQQVLVNLLSNAIKYNHEHGTVEIAIERRPGNEVRISVIDSGRGIRPDDQARLFEPFERIDQLDSMVGGTGIGLSLCKKLAEQMGGKIGLESKFGSGSTFWIDLLEASVETDDRSMGNEDDVRRQATSLKGIRVLYVEDHLPCIRLMSEIVQIVPDCEILAANNAPDGVALAKSVLPDLILMDINLPGPMEYDALDMLRNDERTSQIPVIALSATSSGDILEWARQAGFAHFLSKPLHLEQLFEAIACVCRQHTDMTAEESVRAPAT